MFLSLALGLGWAWPGEREGLWAGLCSPSANDRAHCTQYKSLWPINTTSTRIKSTHMHLLTQKDYWLFTPVQELRLWVIVNNTISHTHDREWCWETGLRSAVAPYRAHQTGLGDGMSLLPASLPLPFSEIVCYLAAKTPPEREADMKRIASDEHRALMDKHSKEQMPARKQRLGEEVVRLMLFGAAWRNTNTSTNTFLFCERKH